MSWLPQYKELKKQLNELEKENAEIEIKIGRKWCDDLYNKFDRNTDLIVVLKIAVKAIKELMINGH